MRNISYVSWEDDIWVKRVLETQVITKPLDKNFKLFKEGDVTKLCLHMPQFHIDWIKVRYYQFKRRFIGPIWTTVGA